MKIKFVLFLIFSCSELFSQNINFDKGFIKERNYFAEIAYELINEKIIVPVAINGKIYKFLLDTGAPNIISTRIFEELNLVKISAGKISDANNVLQSMQVTEIPSIKIGTLNFEKQPTLIYDFDNNTLFSCYQIDGIIGSNLLRKSILKINTSQQKIYITNNVKNVEPKTKPTKITLVGSQKSPLMQVGFIGKNNKKANDIALIDTGMDGYYDMSNRAFNYFVESEIFETVAKAEGVSGIGIFGAGTVATQRLLKAETTILNNTSVKNLLIETTDDTNSRIGLAFLNHGNLIIDFRHKNAYFEASDTIVLENNIPKYTPTIIDNKFVVGIVWDENLAKKMSHGDEIISIDSQKLSKMPFCDVLNLGKELKNKEKVTIDYRNKENEIRSIVIEK
ncbi:retropepsin-like aspartic protease [Flavobacterium antarcticum]|uniref:retropepsin-like aspartic protease n=1 Tax=Flavobacterium antarcticum TaxID=271155 RepID=UPI0003B4E896|nr:aspartyl protease family protein [Flavobacterium antarcticum]